MSEPDRIRGYPNSPEFREANRIAFEYFAPCRGDPRPARDPRFYMLRDDIYQALLRVKEQAK